MHHKQISSRIQTYAVVGNDLRKDVHDFTQQLRGIATNIYALTSCVETVGLHAVENLDSNFTNLHKDHLENIYFDIYDTCGLLPKLKQDLSLISNKLESSGGIDCNGNCFSCDKEASQWFLYHRTTICIVVCAV